MCEKRHIYLKCPKCGANALAYIWLEYDQDVMIPYEFTTWTSHKRRNGLICENVVTEYRQLNRVAS